MARLAGSASYQIPFLLLYLLALLAVAALNHPAVKFCPVLPGLALLVRTAQSIGGLLTIA